MSFKLIAKSSNPPLGALTLMELIRLEKKIDTEIVWSEDPKTPGNVQLIAKDGVPVGNSETEIARFVARTLDENLYGGTNPLERTEVDSWLSFAIGHIANTKVTEATIDYLNSALALKTWLAAKQLTIADICVFSALHDSQDSLSEKTCPNLCRWFKQMLALPAVKSISPFKKQKQSQKKEQGKFNDLQGAEMGKVVVRFPPEASGFLHIGHAKAALLNQYYAENYKGKLIMRFDDTNPAKENVEFEQAILHDLKLLEIKPDLFTHSSDYFDLMLEYCESLIKKGKAFVDDTPAETMKEQREQKLPSLNRDACAEKNLELWKEMQKGTVKGQECCVRAKIDFESANGCMRDPTIYRCKPEPHPRTGTKYKVYPTYDFTCPIVDAVEGVTHTLRTTEYQDRDPQFYWFIEALGLNRPYIYGYARLNMTNTVLSKRKLTWLVSEGAVDGWDDPRFPTVRGILRRGLTVEGLKQFIIAQGSSKSVVFMEWDKIWAFNKKVIDPVAVRYTALAPDTVPVFVEGAESGFLTAQNHPKDPEKGTKKVRIGPKIFIEREDAELLKAGQNATFINWGNLLIGKIVKGNDGEVVSVSARVNLGNKDFKNTPKLTWLCEEGKKVPCCLVFFQHIISKPVLGKDEDFKDFVAKDTRREQMALGEPEIARVKEGEIIQLQRKGFFRCDVAFSPISAFSSREQSLVLFHVPDGHVSSPGINFTPKVGSAKPVFEGTDVGKQREKIVEQGEKVRKLKSEKAGKADIDREVKSLIALKAEYRAISGTDWKPENPVKKAAANSESEISGKITRQGDKIRELKSAKAEKSVIEAEVKVLLGLKSEYKSISGSDWKPENPVKIIEKKAANPESEISEKITKQGDKIRELKSAKAEKSVIEAEVKVLLGLKSEYKSISGTDWKPENPVKNMEKKAVAAAANPETEISGKITRQGDKIRELKSAKAEKSVIEAEVKILLGLKSEYKSISGTDWKPENPVKNVEKKAANPESEISGKITKQGDKIRELKSAKAEKSIIEAEVKILLGLKSEYKSMSGTDWKPENPVKTKKPKPSEKKKPEVEKKEEISTKTGTRLGLEAKKSVNLADWYSQVITKGELIEYYDVSGCYILRPGSFAIWESIRDYMDEKIKALGVQNCYFPIFVSRGALEREKDHIADFAPEVAWVTKSGESDLAEPIAIRPTSETVMYPAYAKWLRTYRDLPLKLNQWNNVVRWEFKHPQPFLRTREFLWQEGHTAFATKEEADEEVLEILNIYASIYEDLLAVPVVRGRKTEKEKFAGGDYTTTVEAFVSASGRGIQGGTSHHLGQNFSKMFDIQVESAEEGGERIFVYQNSWGITTRSIGVMVMVHGDDKGLVLPPRVASIQVVIVPCGITASTSQEQRQKLLQECCKLEKELTAKGKLRIKGDYRDNYSPGWKFNHWELKGVPARLELGPKDLEKNEITLVRRDNGERLTTGRDNAYQFVDQLLKNIQSSMFEKAKKDLDEHVKQTNDWNEFCAFLDKKNLILAPFCGAISCEDEIKTDSTREDLDDPTAPSMGAKSLCVPFEQPKGVQMEKLKCVNKKCRNKPKKFTLFGRSY